MAFNTGNPIGSTDARDLSDNAENFDTALGTTAATWVDRLGVTRDSFEGRLAKGSFYRVGDFATGYTLTNMRQTLEYSGHEYSWAGTFPKVVAAGATPATSGGIGAGAWVDRTDETLRTELSSPAGVSLVATNKFHVYIHSAPDDGITDATSFFTSAAAIAAVNNVDVIVKPPAVSYLLSSNPVVPKEVNILASPSWFSGAGELPIHSYQRLSEGVDPRDLELGYSVLMGSSASQNGRKWAIQGAVDITQQPLGDGTEADSVGISGRGYARAVNARVWGGVVLALLGPETTGGTASAIGYEIDINNNKGHVGQLDGETRAKGLIIASGGTFRPEEARLVLATMPDNANGDNRFYVGDRFSGNSFLRAVQWFDDEVLAPAQSIGYQSRTELRFSDGSIGWSNAQNQTTGAIQSKASKADGGFEWLSSNGSKQLFTVTDSALAHKIPDLQATTDTTSESGIDANSYCKFNVTTTGSIGGITGGYNGQTIYIANFSGGSLEILRGTNMRTPSGLSVSIPQLAVACFTMQGGVWLLNYVGVQNQ